MERHSRSCRRCRCFYLFLCVKEILWKVPRFMRMYPINPITHKFGDTYAPRGRQTICSGEPPDETYNAAVRLIKQAHSCEQLKELVQRQLWIYSCQRHRLRHREHVQQSQNAIADDDNDEDDDDDSNRNHNHNDDSNNSNNRKTCSGQRDHGGSSSSSSNNVNRNHYKLNINKNKVENLQRQQEHQQQQQQRRRIDFYTYLQLANGYYEQGLQANIKYLESIGKRNAIKTKQQQQQHQQQQHLRDTVDSAVLPLVKLLKSWRRGKNNVGNKNSYPIAEQSIDAIRVHIRPNIQHQQQQQQQKQQQLTHYYHNQQQQQQHHQNVADKLTMCDYFVKPSSSNLSATFDQCKFYEIIDNLSQLSLTNESNIDRLQLPLITLTDYTQHQQQQQQQQQQQLQQQQVAASHEQQQMHIPNEARPPKSLVTFTK
ncbi:GATA zinc finger domain-containing protein 10 isoform X1 [Drosophila willistoni]|uniref:GATA zinc finger domain-containing protein 10 isoform X1 n=1 Tax=Drosophila willistoni TaxID=7260 RepID=UPI000C26CF6B|nr:GATA zinc finger domain-containing protein 10 isoform X1 [Drosophila willistoni]